MAKSQPKKDEKTPEVYAGAIGNFKVLGVIDTCDEHGTKTGELEVGSIQEVPVKLGNSWVKQGLAERVTKKAPAKKVTVKKAAAPAPTKGDIHIVIETKGETYTADVDNVAEYLLGLGIEYTNTRTILKATAGKLTKDFIFGTNQAKRLFNNKLRAEVFERDLKLVLNVRSK